MLDGNAFGAAGVRALLRCVISADDDHEDEAATEFDPKRDSVVSASGSSSGKGREDPRSISLVGCNFQVGWRLFCAVLLPLRRGNVTRPVVQMRQLVFEPSAPAGTYDLNLENPYDAVGVRLLSAGGAATCMIITPFVSGAAEHRTGAVQDGGRAGGP